MSNVVIYDPSSMVVPNRVLSYLISVNTPDYLDRTDAFINPNVSALGNVNVKYWKVETETPSVFEMNSSDKSSVDAFLIAKNNPVKNYKIMTYDLNNKLIKETWYEIDNGDGTYSTLAQEALYVYSNQAIVSITTTIYCYDGSEFSSNIVRYYKNDRGQYIEKNAGA